MPTLSYPARAKGALAGGWRERKRGRGAPLPERPGQAAGEEAQQAQGQHQEEDADDRSEDHVQGGGQEGHLEVNRVVRSGLHTLYTLVTLPLDSHCKALGQWPVTWLTRLCAQVNLWALAQEG